jgi:hypothetical protein
MGRASHDKGRRLGLVPPLLLSHSVLGRRGRDVGVIVSLLALPHGHRARTDEQPNGTCRASIYGTARNSPQQQHHTLQIAAKHGTCCCCCCCSLFRMLPGGTMLSNAPQCSAAQGSTQP